MTAPMSRYRHPIRRVRRIVEISSTLGFLGPMPPLNVAI